MTGELTIDSNMLAWEQSKWPGIRRRQLRLDAETGGRTVLLKFESGALLARHVHPGGEELFVLDGRVRIEGKWYETGWYRYQPPKSVDDVFTGTGATILVMLPKPHVDLT
jgi:anti-sigma factor ChrR (cupin superfamily)